MAVAILSVPVLYFVLCCSLPFLLVFYDTPFPTYPQDTRMIKLTIEQNDD